MEAITLYLLKSIIWLTGFALIYMLFLRNERFFSLNRIFLISGALASICFPLINWHYVVELPMVLTPEDPNLPLVNTAISTSESPVLNPLFLAYLSGACFLFFRLIKQLFLINGIIRKSEITKFNSVKLIRTNRYAAPFSFFSFVFVNPSTNDIETNEIVHHEAEHIRQKHWIDLLLFETLCIIQWFNPMIWLYGRFIRQNHEYLADEKALQRTANPAIYRAALLNQMFDAPVIQLANSFNYSLNKKRFNMMKQTINSPIRKLKLLLVLPLIGGVFYAFASPEYKLVYSENSVQNELSDNKPTQQPGGTNSGIQIEARHFRGEVNASSTTILADSFKIKKTPVNDSIKQKKPSLIIIDGIEFSEDDMNRLKPENIESISILKDESAKALYGEKGKNGVILITSKNANVLDKKTATSNLKIGYAPSALSLNLNNPFNATDQPIYVLDGKRISNFVLDKVSPANILSVTVLKNESAKALYGEDAKNGVVIITSKSGSEKISDDMAIGSGTQNSQENSTSDGKIVIRNTDPSMSKNPPLIVIDGTVQKGKKISDIDPETISSIAVLKDENATKKYGVDGENGVIEITTKAAKNGAFVNTEQMPEFPGGQAALRKYLNSNIRYPAKALRKGIEGKVFVSFTITTTGQVVDVKISRGVDASLDKEAIRIVKSMPKWTPGMVVDEKTKKLVASPMTYTVPVTFKLPISDNHQTSAASSKGKLIIAPNPTDNNATITLDGSDSQNKLDVSIYDRLGKLVKKEQKTGPSFNISVADLIIGTYYLLVTDGSIQYTGTLQIAK